MNAPGDSRSSTTSLHPTSDARAIVRLVQCSQCSLLFRTPVTLPCGNSLCRQCLPEPRARQNVTYPATEARLMCIDCPFRECRRVHSVEDCSTNVVLAKVMDSVLATLSHFQAEASPGSTTVEEILRKLSITATADSKVGGESEDLGGDNDARTQVEDQPDSDLLEQEKSTHDLALPESLQQAHSSSWPWGHLLASFASAQAGELRYTSEALYYHESIDSANMETQDRDLLKSFKEADQTRREVECYVCYQILLDPATTPCGHTFCRDCLRRNLDHSRLCPACRRRLPLPSSLETHPKDRILSELLNALYPDKVAARIELANEDERRAMEYHDTALFVCTMSFPSMPTYLHIFEPRYRLMIRRAIDGGGTFGMVSYNDSGLPQGRLGDSQFCEFGTMLRIERYQLLPDGRSFVQCRGTHRFRILEHGIRDGYVVGKVEKFEDISLADEEAVEAQETSRQPPAHSVDSPAQSRIDHVPTAELMRTCTNFVEQSRASNPPWLRGRIIDAYGEPPSDAALFPYWFASVLPLQDHEKYRLLPLRSTRDRLKVAVSWIETIQSQRWLWSRLLMMPP